MKHQTDTRLLLHLVFYPVQNLVALQRRQCSRKFHVCARELAAWSVVVYEQVVRVDHLGMREDALADPFHELGIGFVAQQRVCGVLEELDSARDNEQPDERAEETVDLNAGETRDEGAAQHRGSRDHVVSRVD